MIGHLSSAHFIGFFTISFLLAGSVVNGINWNGNWALSCDFHGNDLSNVRSPGEQCSTKCAQTKGCTHYSWTNYNGGTCWMKSGSVSKSNAVSNSDSSSVCGVLNDTPAPSGGGNTGGIISEDKFRCVFKDLDDNTRRQRYDGLKNSGWKPKNADEAAVFLAHVYHETAGLQTTTEYCAPDCGSHYAGSWCDVQGAAGKLYYGRGWFQLSWPCNYNAAGKALGLDLLNHPEWVSDRQEVGVKTAVWFFQTNKMDEPAQRGDFAATTRIINGALECNGGSGASNQRTRVETYKRVRQCFGLGEPKINPSC